MKRKSSKVKVEMMCDEFEEAIIRRLADEFHVDLHDVMSECIRRNNPNAVEHCLEAV